MKHFLKKVALVCAVLGGSIIGMTSCSNEDQVVAPGGETRAVTRGSGLITTDTQWSGEIFLEEKVAVTNNATLTILPGTKIVGKSVPENETDNLDATAIVITKGAKIKAEGTASNPIVMTAETPSLGWGGLVILGKARINQPTTQYIEGIAVGSFPGVDTSYGGTDDNDNSGILKYVRIEYAGATIGDANELNAFTFGGVGRGTTVEYCQAYHGEDDGFEFFGGCVNAKYLVSTASDDDAFDFDFGYTGKIQFAVATIDASKTYSSDPNGIECDNEKPFNASHTPYTHPVLSNLTIVGTSTGSAASALKSAANFRRGAEFTLVNSIMCGFPKGIYFTDAPQLGASVLSNNIISSVPAGNEIIDGTAGTQANNSFVDNATHIGLGSVWGGNNGLMPGSGSIAISGASFSGLDSWFTTTTYRGAIGGRSNWATQSWVKQ